MANEQAIEIPAMSPPQLLARLVEIGSEWKGLGVAVECGCWLGASACALGLGLARAGYDRKLYLFDIWRANRREVEKAAAAGVELSKGQDLRPLCLANLASLSLSIVTRRGQIEKAKWHGEGIEIFILDGAKRDPAFIHTMLHFAPYWVPSGIVGLFDFKYWKRRPPEEQEAFRCQERFITRHAGCLEDLGGVEGSSARFFRVLRRLELA